MNHQSDVPVSITSARAGRSADIHRRQVRYLTSMGIRTLCFVGAIVASGWVRWTLVAAALVLPYFAVVVANAADGRSRPGPARFVRQDHRVLEGPVDQPASGPSEAGVQH